MFIFSVLIIIILKNTMHLLTYRIIMAHEKYICLLVLYLSTVSAFSIDYKNERQGKNQCL